MNCKHNMKCKNCGKKRELYLLSWCMKCVGKLYDDYGGTWDFPLHVKE